MYSTSDIKKGLKIELDGQPFEIIEFLHVKPGKGQAFVRTKVRNLMSGAVLDKTFKTGEKIKQPDLTNRNAQFLYIDGEHFVFMDQESYDQVSLDAETVGDAKLYLQDNDEVQLLAFNGEVVSLSIPNHVVLQVVQTDPGEKGNTVSGGTKPATLVTGLVVNVPLFINIDDKLKVDTRTGDYLERVTG